MSDDVESQNNPVADMEAAERTAAPVEGVPVDLAVEKGQSIVRDVSFGGVEDVCTPITVRFKDIVVEVNDRSVPRGRCSCKPYPKKEILHGISGHITPYRMVALLGASGAGKSTLLNVLSRRFNTNSGTVKYNGVEPTAKMLPQCTAYIQQEDLFFGKLTVEEHLMQQAILRLPRGTSTAEARKRVDGMINKLSLTKCRNSRIGNIQQGEGRGISGGERKRLNIASEILTSPSVIFADEPTTGLDSFIAKAAVSALYEFSRQGRTVICTIHQPSSTIFELFDDVMLLSEGRIAFHGERLAAVEWFRRLGHPCGQQVNPAEHLIKVLSLSDENRAEKLPILGEWCDKWEKEGEHFNREWSSTGRDRFMSETLERQESRLELSFQRRETREKIRESNSRLNLGQTATREVEEKELELIVPRPISGWTAFTVMTKRSAICTARDPVLVRARLFQTIIMSLLMGLLFFRLDWDFDDARSKVGALFSCLVSQSMLGIFGVVQTFPVDKPIVQREYESGLINVPAYTMGKMIADLPVQTIFPTIFITIAWYMVGFNDDPLRWLCAIGVLLLVANAAMSLGYFVSAICSDVNSAAAFAAIFMLPQMLFSGFMLDLSTIWVGLRWIQYVSIFKYGVKAIVAIVFYDEMVIVPAAPPLPEREVPSEDFLNAVFGLSMDNFGWNFLGLVMLLTLYRSMAVIGYKIAAERRARH